MFSFEEINKNLTMSGKEDITDQAHETYILSALVNMANLEDINFDKVNLTSLEYLTHNIFDVLGFEDEESGEFELDDHHSYSRMVKIENIIYKFVNVEKKRVPSSFKFI